MTEIKDFELNGKTIKLKTPIILELNRVNDYYYAANNEIELYGNGKTEEEAIESARGIFSELFVLSHKIVKMVDITEVN